MRKKIILSLTYTTIIFLIVSYLNSCDRGPTEPDVKPGKRDYVWRVDTLEADLNFIYKIWGSSPNDVWAVGPGSSYNKTIWHYDGNNWETDEIYRNINPRALWGFSSDKIFIGGQDGKIWRFDGSQWNKFVELSKEGIE